MKKIILAGLAALSLAGCQTVAEDRAASGALIGGAAGTAIGAIAGNSVGSAVAGGVLGAAAGGILGAATAPPEPCYVQTRTGRWRPVRC